MRFHGFDWDDGNWPKCAKHGLSKGEVESIFESESVSVFPAKAVSSGETRSAAFGVTDEGRKVFVVFTVRQAGDRTLIRPISARFMHDKEVRHYEQQKSSKALS